MSLVSQIASFVTRIATEFNTLRSEVATALTAKADASHAHAISDVTNLQSGLDAKANLSGATFTGEVKATLSGYGQFRATNGTAPGFFIRNDGGATYFLLTNNGDPNGSWNSFRPIIINNSNGFVTTTSPAATGTNGLRNTTISTAAPSGGADGDVWLKYS